MLLLIEHGDVFDPAPCGRQSVLVANDRIERIGDVDRRALDALKIPYEVIDADGALVTPGFVDPHEHLLGGSGEGSLALQTPMLFIDEIVRAGITTVVGTLGVDTTMKTMPGLLARVKALNEEGLSARLWSGGYNVPPTTLLGSIREDLMFVDECVGAGEVAISDQRGLRPPGQALAALVRDTHVGGLLSGKAGVTHFHVGEEPTRLAPLRELIDDFGIEPAWLYPTHVERSEELMSEAVALAHRGAAVDIDVVNRDLRKWVCSYLDGGGPEDRLTASSDADSSTPDILSSQLRELGRDPSIGIERMLRFGATNASRVLKLERKGQLRVGCDADLLVLEAGSLDIRHVVARGKRMVIDGACVVQERFVQKSARRWELEGAQAPPDAPTT
jgi:beta-aspartyl-dipeptidase (metallo-type)